MDDETRIADPVNEETVKESLGYPEGEPTPSEEAPKDDLPLAAKERLGRQEKRHKKEMRAMQAQLADLQARMSQQPQAQPFQDQQPINPYTQAPIQPGSVEDQIHRAVSMALQAKEQQERQALQAQQAMKVRDEYQKFNQRLDSANDKYDDFDDVVRSPNAKFTDAMRDTAMVLPNAEDVLYKLGKNPAELERISQLDPISQSRELVALSHALANGDMGKGNHSSAGKVMNEIKGTPMTSGEINEKTPISVLRKKMLSGWH